MVALLVLPSVVEIWCGGDSFIEDDVADIGIVLVEGDDVAEVVFVWLNGVFGVGREIEFGDELAGEVPE